MVELPSEGGDHLAPVQGGFKLSKTSLPEALCSAAAGCTYMYAEGFREFKLGVLAPEAN